MEDPRFRAEFHRAFDAVVPPAPWISASVRGRVREQRHDERTWPVAPVSWLVPAVAVLLAISTVAVLLYVGRSHTQRTTPVKPPRVGQAAEGCPRWLTGSSGSLNGNGSGKMTSASTGWSVGALRTTDGGANWRDVAPPAMRADAPSDAGLRPYPPSYVDYFLDSNHAWVARPYSSATSCFDHVTVFITSDGGRTWDESAPIVAAVQADSSLQLQLDFIDPQHGWLMVFGYGRIAPDSFFYSTTDGGHHWKLVSQLPMMYSSCGLTFISQTTGFFGGCRNSGGMTASLTVTRDGGKTWTTLRLPEPFGTSFTVQTPVFLDQNRGFVSVIATSYAGNTMNSNGYLVATTDGGKTWQLLPDLPPGYANAFGFLDANHFWELTSDPKAASQAIYQTSDGGKTWTLLTRDLPQPYLNYPQVIFIDQRTGFILQPSQQIGQAPAALLVTSDGGRTWKEIHPQIS